MRTRFWLSELNRPEEIAGTEYARYGSIGASRC
jgi:hypothetical protein